MNAVVPAVSAAGFLARYAREREALGGDLAARDAAAAYLRAHGFPSTRDEAWKYTSLRPLDELALDMSASVGSVVLPALGALEGAPRAVFVNGRLSPGLSRTGSCMRPGVFPSRSDNAIVALNTLLSAGGVSIGVPAGRDGGAIVLTHVGQAGGSAYPFHAITLGEGARLTLLELAVSDGPSLLNHVAHITLASGATLTHARVQMENTQAVHLATIEVEIGAGARYDGFTLTLGAHLSRCTLRARLTAPQGHASLNAAARIGGRQHADFTTVVRHAAPDCRSRQTVKNVLADHARAVFQGRIEVAREAQRTDGYQMNQALLLSEHAEIDSKPELEIFADDVKCSHGATVGALDGDQLFYLASRGIPQAEARAMLVQAFLEAALDDVEDETLRGYLAGLIESAP